MKKLFAALVLFFPALWLRAQDSVQQQEQNTGMRAGGKIYVVMTVTIVILIGLLIYMIRLDRKISKLEK